MLRLQLEPIHVPVARANESAVVVIGAHLWGDDPHDPLFAAVHNVAWRSVWLLEANPLVFRTLRARIAAQTHRSRFSAPVRVLNEGACPASTTSGSAGALPFYAFNPPANVTDVDPWASQISSFDRHNIERHFPAILAHGRHTIAQLEGYISSVHIPCRTIPELLHGVGDVAVLLIDTEGLDCRLIVETMDDLCARAASGSPPSLLAFEWKHCTRSDYLLARARLTAGPTAAHACPRYRAIAETGENAFYRLTRSDA